MASRSRSHRPRGWRRRLEDIWASPRGRTVTILGVLVVLAGVLFTWEAFRAYNALQDADDRARVLQENIVEGDDIDLWQFPAPKWHATDGGRYIDTFCGVVTEDKTSRSN